MDKKYEIIIFWSAEDNSYVAEVPELPGCMADGKTYQEALRNAEQIIEEWIETAAELGRPIPQPKGRLAYAWHAGDHCKVGGAQFACVKTQFGFAPYKPIYLRRADRLRRRGQLWLGSPNHLGLCPCARTAPQSSRLETHKVHRHGRIRPTGSE